jgi:hypothetical protein
VKGAYPQCADGLRYPVRICAACGAIAPLCFAPCNLTRCPGTLVRVDDPNALRTITAAAKGDKVDGTPGES